VKIDDPVGALSVHLVNGVFGTLAIGLFATDGGLFYGGGAARLVSQVIGVAAFGAMVFGLSMVVWLVLKMTMGVRVTAAEEAEGLDMGEHGMDAYPGFVPTQEARVEVI
jgi:Amt family ammonium transporter